MKKRIVGFSVVVVAMATIAAAYFFLSPSVTTQTPVQIETVVDLPHTGVAPSIEPGKPPPTHYPIDTNSILPTLPAASQPSSNAQDGEPALDAALGALISQKVFALFVNSEGLVRRIVATIDNLPREKVAVQLLPIKPLDSSFIIKRDNTRIFIAPENAERYASYVNVIQMLDAKQLALLYTHFYPLFQQTYQDLGYPKGYFNDRLVEVIDHLLNCPDISEPIALIQPHVYYQYADPKLESMSAGEKILLRMGKSNALKIKEKLREIRKEITVKQSS